MSVGGGGGGSVVVVPVGWAEPRRFADLPAKLACRVAGCVHVDVESTGWELTEDPCTHPDASVRAGAARAAERDHDQARAATLAAMDVRRSYPAAQPAEAEAPAEHPAGPLPDQRSGEGAARGVGDADRPRDLLRRVEPGGEADRGDGRRRLSGRAEAGPEPGREEHRQRRGSQKPITRGAGHPQSLRLHVQGGLG